MMNGLSKTQYRQLLSAFLPHTISNETEYKEVQAEIGRLIDQDELTKEETAYLDLLGTLVWAYEAKTEDKANYTLRGIELLKGLLELHNLKQIGVTQLTGATRDLSGFANLTGLVQLRNS
ncbi:MAG: hypothetical protein DYG89_45090 [Caldilinea sp. CFX5]|nr:hypothetical protein [Caldilinea sp. CFX5]